MEEEIIVGIEGVVVVVMVLGRGGGTESMCCMTLVTTEGT